MNGLDFDEVKQSQLPFVELLINLGYTYLSIDELKAQRNNDTSYNLLGDIARESLMSINGYEHKGKVYKFSEKDIAEAVSELEHIKFDGLLDTSQNIYHRIMPFTGGKTIKVFHGGRAESKSFRFIDFEKPNNNAFHVAVEVPLSGKKENSRPDIVVYVNGIPFAVIENKKSSVEVEQAVNQMIRNQSPAYSPRFFTYPQLLVASNDKQVRYGTTDTKTKFYTTWTEKELSLDNQNKQASSLIGQQIDQQVYTQLTVDLGKAKHRQKLDRTPTEQDRFATNMFNKNRLLDLTRNYILYDAGVKKIMRYQQFFAVNKALSRVHEIESSATGNRRKGGIIWHTQGSGKSLIMVMFVKAIIEDPGIINPRVLVVTDRKDLDRYIKNTFVNAGLKKNVKQAKSGEDLLRLIKNKDSSVITTLVHKFQSAARRRAGFVDPDKNIFVLIDEAHRTQHGQANLEMNRTVPNACYIAFTGTPLLKDQKSNNKFGPFIDKYTIDDALHDKVVLPLIYEGRYVNLKQNKRQIDRLFERQVKSLTEAQKKKIQKNVANRVIKDNPQRISEIAYDIEKHYTDKFQGHGLKAQVVAPSKFSAILMHDFFTDSDKLQVGLVISDGNGIIDERDEHKRAVDQYLRRVKDRHQSLQKHEEKIIDSFKENPAGVEVLIVVDKLLTGFDAPPNTVLYLTKELRDHNLLQAIARVNRLYDNPKAPKTAGYIIDYSENARNLKDAMDLFGNYDEDDVKGTLADVDEKVDELRGSYKKLCAIFRGVKSDDEAYLQHLKKDEPTRKEFYDTLNSFIRNFNECMVLHDFVHKFEDLDTYRRELKKFAALRKTVASRCGDQPDFSRYKHQLVQILDKHITAEEAELLTKEIDITNRELFRQEIEKINTDKSRAEVIAAQTKRIISERIEKDPVLYRSFSKRIEEILDGMRLKKLTDAQAFEQLRLLSEEVLLKKDIKLPKAMTNLDGADILYRNLKKLIPTEPQIYEKSILALHEIILENTRVDWWKNHEMKRVIRNKIDDFVYDDLKMGEGIKLSDKKRRDIVDKVMELAENNHEVFKGDE